MSEVVQFLEWDSRFFGFPIGRICPEHLNPAAIARALDWAKEREIRCLYCLCDSKELDAVESLEQNGFHLVDVRLTMESKLRKPNQDETTVLECRIRPARSSDIPVLQDIAQESHTDSRFFTDRHFPRTRCGELYRRWIQRDAEDSATTLLVADLCGEPVGYLSCRLASAETALISLVAVSVRARGRRIGKLLIQAAFNHALIQGRERIGVVTQGSNIIAQQLYQAAGFRTAALQIWFHRWFDPPPPTVSI